MKIETRALIFLEKYGNLNAAQAYRLLSNIKDKVTSEDYKKLIELFGDLCYTVK